MGNVAIPGNGIWIRRGCPPTASALRLVIARLRRSRGNLAAAGRIVGKPSTKAQLPAGDSHVASLLGMTREEGTLRFALAPLRVKQAIRFVIARLRRSRGNLAVHARNTGKPRRIR